MGMLSTGADLFNAKLTRIEMLPETLGQTTANRNFRKMISPAPTQHAALVVAARSVAIPATFLFNIMLSRMLGPAGVGAFQFCISVSLIAAAVAGLGLGMRMLRDSARARESDLAGDVRPAFLRKICIVTITGAGAAALLISAETQIGGNAAEQQPFSTIFCLVCLSIPVFCVLTLSCRLIAGMGDTARAVLLERAAMPILGLALVPILAAGGKPQGAAGAHLLATGIAAVIAVRIALSKLTADETRLTGTEGDHPQAEKGKLSAYIGWLVRTLRGAPGEARASRHFLTSQLLLVSLGSVDLLILGFLADHTEVGLFNAVLRLTIGATFLRLPLYTRISPAMAVLSDRGDRQELFRTSTRGARLVTAGTLPLVALLIFLPELVLGLFGPEFDAAAPALAVVAIGKLVEAAAGPSRELLLMSDHERRLSVATGMSLALQFSLGVILVPSLGLMGAAISNLIGTIFLSARTSYDVYQEFGFLPWCLAPAPSENWTRK